MVLFFRSTRKRFKKCSRFCRRHYYYSSSSLQKAKRELLSLLLCVSKRVVCVREKREVVFCVFFFLNCVFTFDAETRRREKNKNRNKKDENLEQKKKIYASHKSHNFYSAIYSISTINLLAFIIKYYSKKRSREEDERETRRSFVVTPSSLGGLSYLSVF